MIYEPLQRYDEILTIRDLQKVLHIGKNGAYQLVKSGAIKSIKIGTRYKIPKKYLLDYIYEIEREIAI